MFKQRSYLQKLVDRCEDQQLDFKFEVSDSKKIAKTMSAFANTDGGTLLIGVKDNGTIAGVRTDEELYMVEAAANMYCKPEIPFTTRAWVEAGKTVLEVIIPKNNEEIVTALDSSGKWIAYLRVKDNNFMANTVILQVWKRRRSGLGTLLRYTDKEKILLDYLNEFESVTISKFGRIALITREIAEHVLVNLIMLNIIEIVFDDQSIVYKLKK